MKQNPSPAENPPEPKPAPKPGYRYRQQYGVLVICADEQAQEQAYTHLATLNYTCKVVSV